MTTSHRLFDLFEQALEQPPDRRSGWLDTACDGDGALRAELERLLAADAAADAAGFLDRTPAVPVALDDWEGLAVDYAPGSLRFGAYALLRLIGRGGMGEVHLAERRDGEFEQRVALKLLPLPTPGLVRRFRRERQILARLQHPHIARLLDGGVGEHGVPYFVLEYVEGQPITQWADAAQLDVRGRVRLMLAVCDAVQYAHGMLIVHRDLKPSNILVGSDGEPKLLDFGIARVLQGDDGEAPTQGRSYTPDYAAPEQIRGEAVSTATDVYSLGVVLYELLSGVRPHASGSRNEGFEHARLTAEPVSPSAAVPPEDTMRRRACAATSTASCSRRWPASRPGATRPWKPWRAICASTSTACPSVRARRVPATACASSCSATAWPLPPGSLPAWPWWPAAGWRSGRPIVPPRRPSRRRPSATCIAPRRPIPRR